MSRLILSLGVLAILAALAYAAVSGLRAMGGRARTGPVRAEFEGRSMQKVSYVLLVALILYTAIWGGG